MAKKKFSHIILLIINFILWTISVHGSEQKSHFNLNTTTYVRHKPITSDAIKASQNINNLHDIDAVPHKKSELGSYCIAKKRNGYYLQNDANVQNYISVRGGLVLNYTNCDTGSNALVKLKRHTVYGYYQIKF